MNAHAEQRRCVVAYPGQTPAANGSQCWNWSTHAIKRGSDNPLQCDLLVIDETSMVDVMLMQALAALAPARLPKLPP